MHHIHISTEALVVISIASLCLVWLVIWAVSQSRQNQPYKTSKPALQYRYSLWSAQDPEPETYYPERSTGGYKRRSGAVAPPMTPTTEQ